MDKKNIGPVVIAVIVTAIVVAAGMHYCQMWRINNPYQYNMMYGDNPYRYNMMNGTERMSAVSFNCKQSGGTFQNGSCRCSTTGEEKSTYEPSTGYCITADGSPAGELGVQARQLLEFKMMKK